MPRYNRCVYMAQFVLMSVVLTVCGVGVCGNVCVEEVIDVVRQ